MVNVDSCALIIKDDFKNVLILENKVKKTEIPSWSILVQKKRSRETEEKCINRIAKDALKSIIFDLQKLFDYAYENQQNFAVYVGDLKERIVLDKSYKSSKWISKNEIDNYNLDDFSKQILIKYFNE